jgi:hypothetical protein
MQQDIQRRFVFRGSAVAFGGRLYRPEGIVLATHGSSALSVVGGRSTARVEKVEFKQFVSIESGSADVEGSFVDLDKARQLSELRPGDESREDGLATHTVVRVAVNGISIGEKKRVTIRHISARMRAESAPRKHEPAFTFPKEQFEARGGQPSDLHVDGLVIDDKRVDVFFDPDRFNSDLTTLDRLKSRSRSKTFREAHEPLLGALGDLRRIGRGQVVLVKVFRRFAFPDGQPETVKVDGNSLIVHDFGTIFFGEMLVTDQSRRLTMVRMRLGSPEGGDADFAEVETNGSWIPPIPP